MRNLHDSMIAVAETHMCARNTFAKGSSQGGDHSEDYLKRPFGTTMYFKPFQESMCGSPRATHVLLAEAAPDVHEQAGVYALNRETVEATLREPKGDVCAMDVCAIATGGGGGRGGGGRGGGGELLAIDCTDFCRTCWPRADERELVERRLRSPRIDRAA